MKMKLTKRERATAMRAVLHEIQNVARQGIARTPSGWLYESDREWPEVKRLVRVALAAVRKVKP